MNTFVVIAIVKVQQRPSKYVIRVHLLIDVWETVSSTRVDVGRLASSTVQSGSIVVRVRSPIHQISILTFLFYFHCRY